MREYLVRLGKRANGDSRLDYWTGERTNMVQ